MSWGAFYVALEHNCARTENPSSVNAINKLKPSVESHSHNVGSHTAHHAKGLPLTTLSTCYLHVGLLLVSPDVLSVFSEEK